jgi:hypothetical protein
MADEVAIFKETTVVEIAAPVLERRLGLFLFGGALMLLVGFGDPGQGLANIPVSFFLKNRLHLKAHELAVFRLWIAAPLFASFAFGMLRDRWSPFGSGDRGLLILFGLLTAALWATLALLPPTYGVLLGGLIIVTAVFQIVSGAGAGLLSTIGQRRALAGQMSALLSVAVVTPQILAALAGGALSDFLETRGAATAARILFGIAAMLLLGVALLGALRPRALFDHDRFERPTTHFFQDVGRLLRHRPVYPVLIMQALWQFGPANGIVLQYHMANALHGTDFEWGAWNAVFLGFMVPIFIAYGFLCQRIPLRWLLWIGFVPATFQMVPLLFAHTAVEAIWMAALLGIIGGLAQGAITDLAIRSCPPRLQGTMMLLYGTSIYFLSTRFSDLAGAEIYDRWGFAPTVWVTVAVYALILPVILLVPRRLTATRDGEPLLTSLTP